MIGAQLGRERVASIDSGDLDRNQAMESLIDHGKDLDFNQSEMVGVRELRAREELV